MRSYKDHVREELERELALTPAEQETARTMRDDEGSVVASIALIATEPGLEWPYEFRRTAVETVRREHRERAETLDETRAEELGRLRRELSEIDPEWPEYRATLGRISVLVRERAEARRDRRRAEETAR